METKTSNIAVKRAGEGKATVVIATLGVKDKDGDVLLAGAFGDQVVPVVGAHEWKMPPIGKARIREVGQEAVADIEFNDTTEGQNWYQALKFDWEHPPAKQQYSWGFQVPQTHTHRGKHHNEDVRFLHGSDKGEPLPIFEVSPVLVGAGHNTRSLSIKAFDDLPAPEEAEGTWDDLKAAGVQVQSLVFPKDRWESAEAVRSWLSSHGYRTEIDTTSTSYRARQASPGDFQRLRSFCINPSRDASAEACRVMAVGGPLKESRSMLESEVPVVEMTPETPQAPLDGAALLSVEDYKNYPEDRRPPLPVLISWLRLYRYHMPFLRDIRKRDHKEISPETIAEFKTLVEEMLEVTSGLNIKLMTSKLLPNVEEEELQRQQYERRFKELSADTEAEEARKLQAIQAAAQDLAQKARARSAQMREMFRE